MHREKHVEDVSAVVSCAYRERTAARCEVQSSSVRPMLSNRERRATPKEALQLEENKSMEDGAALNLAQILVCELEAALRVEQETRREAVDKE